MIRTTAAILALLAIALAVQKFPAADIPKTGRLTKEEQEALRPGLTLRFYADAKAERPLDARRARLIALHVPADASPTPLLPPGPFAARFTGYLKTTAKLTASFRVVGTGTATLSVNGKEAAKLGDGKEGANVDLPRGFSWLDLTYASPPKGDASLRVYWSGEGFASEPVPPDVFFSRGDEADIVTGEKWRDGRQLYATLGCAHCHALPGKLKRDACAMPEMRHRAPTLDNVGKRLHPDWLARWIADPRSLRASATMPKTLRGEPAAIRQQAADLAAYLGTLNGAPVPADAKSTDALLKEGGKLFDKLNCVVCHQFKEPGQEDTHGRLSLHFVAGKFQPGALAAFLRSPHEHYAWTRMPDFKLDAKEVAALTAFIVDQSKGKPAGEPIAKADAERGAKLFREVGCAQCHALKPGDAALPTTLAAPAAAALEKGCLADKPDAQAPDFGLADAQRQALRGFLGTDGSSLTRETAAEFSLRQVKALQCNACHRRDGVGSRTYDVAADEGDGTLPELLPSLTWTGQKLKPVWSARLLSGKADHRARPWLKSRMPAFSARAEMLALGLSHEHGYAAEEDAPPAPDAKLAPVGEKLIANVGGFNCVSCHGVGKQPPIAPFEAPGINLLDAAQRLRYEYYPRWMMDPARVDVATKMPKFAPDGHGTALKDILDGDARKQFDAIWHYMATLPDKK